MGAALRRLVRGWALRAHTFFLLLLREHRAPGRVALAVLVGCVVGTTPLFGLHFPLCVLAALCLRLNKLIVYGAANLSIPPMVPVLGFLSVQLGERLRHGAFVGLHRAEFAAAPRALAERFFVSWLLGGLVLGAAIGAVTGGATYLLLRRRGAKGHAASNEALDAGRGAGGDPGDPIPAALSRASARYDGLHPRFRYYARAKYRMDPCYRAIAALTPPGASVVDLGTGLGMLPVLLGELGEGRSALGVEWDQAKVACGQQAAAGLAGVRIEAGDARAFPIPPCTVVTLVDMLHYYDEDTQRALLARAAAALAPGGRLLIREGDPERRGGARFTRSVERWMVRLGWNRGPGVRFRPIDDLCADLAHLGLTARRAEVAGALHPGNVLLCAEKAQGILPRAGDEPGEPGTEFERPER
jgi:SAM-dependent methyltransferase/uncharacterized protein (DUF2062 family)